MKIFTRGIEWIQAHPKSGLYNFLIKNTHVYLLHGNKMEIIYSIADCFYKDSFLKGKVFLFRRCLYLHQDPVNPLTVYTAIRIRRFGIHGQLFPNHRAGGKC